MVAMAADKFWAQIEPTLAAHQDQERQLRLLTKQLSKCSAGELVDFREALDQRLAEAYTWELWGAAFVIHGGCSDDAFEYFCRWLISRGRGVFHAVLAKPEALADLIPADQEEFCEFEAFNYVAGDIWVQKTRRSLADFPYTGDARPREPAGAPFSEDEAHLAARYPRLWARFGDQPLD
jgi:hypothetical protein